MILPSGTVLGRAGVGLLVGGGGGRGAPRRCRKDISGVSYCILATAECTEPFEIE